MGLPSVAIMATDSELWIPKLEAVGIRVVERGSTKTGDILEVDYLIEKGPESVSALYSKRDHEEFAHLTFMLNLPNSSTDLASTVQQILSPREV